MTSNTRLRRFTLLLLASAITTAVSAGSSHTPTTRIERHALFALQSQGHDLVSVTAGSGTGERGGDLTIALTVTPYTGDPNECGTETAIDVRIGDQVNICYTLANNGSQTLTHQSLTDSLDGDLLAWEPLAIGPGQSHAFVRTIIASDDTTRSATWTGFATLPSYSFDDNAAPNFINIASTGTDIGFVPGDGNDNEHAAVTAGFPIRLYGAASTDLCISIDGFIGFDDPVCASPSPGSEPPPGYSFNQDIPTTVGWGNINVPGYLAPMWGNLGDGPGRVYMQTLGTAPDRRFIVQWDNLHHYAISETSVTFQVQFEEATGTFRYEYSTTAFGNFADNGGASTVGLQGDPRGLYAKYSYYQPVLQPNSAIVWTYTPSVDQSAASGSVSISAGDPVLAVAQSSIAGLTTAGNSTQATLTVRNDGNRDLSWSVSEAPGGSAAHIPQRVRHVATIAGGPAAPDGARHMAAGHRPATSVNTFTGQRGTGFNVPAYAISWFQPGVVSFDALDPVGTATPVNTSTDWIYAASFLDNDFSRLWVIVQDSWDHLPGTYGTVDVATGAFTIVGRIEGAPSHNWAGLTQDPLTGMVYAANFSNNPFSAESTLYSLDLTSGQATRIGLIEGPGIHPVRFIPGLAVSPDGLMYGLDLYGQSLIAINKTTGYASVIESLGLDVRYTQDIEFDQSTGDLFWGALYNVGGDNFVAEMRVIDPLTALSQPIAPLPPLGPLNADEYTALAIARPSVGCVAPGDVPWLSFDGTTEGTLAPADSQEVIVGLDATELSPGLYEATICVFGDDPRRRAIPVPVALAVMDPEPLFDQSVDDTELRLFNNNVVAPQGTNVLSAESADDFVVDGGGWTVTAFGFTAFGNTGHPVPPSVNLRVLADNGSGAPGEDVLCSVSAASAFSIDTSNRIAVFLPGGCELAPGTYWIAWSFAEINIAASNFGFAGAIAEQSGAPGLWRNPAGALGFGCTSWSPFASCEGLVDASARDLAFSVYATPITSGCDDVIFNDGFDGGPALCP